jgi:tRNA A37 threonylcarbamoyladenosine biosynthesis protein TsaE
MQDLGSVKTFFQREPVTQFRNTNMVSTATFNWNKICKEGSGIPLNPGDLR